MTTHRRKQEGKEIGVVDYTVYEVGKAIDENDEVMEEERETQENKYA